VRLLRKMVGGQFVELAQATGGFSLAHEYIVDLIAKGNQLEVLIDGHPIFSAEDDSFLGGTVGVGSEALQSVFFDNVQVTAIP
jgi:hypothetical protein